MSDLEKNAQEEATKKHPYNLREKKEKKAAYRSLIRPELGRRAVRQDIEYHCRAEEVQRPQLLC